MEGLILGVYIGGFVKLQSQEACEQDALEYGRSFFTDTSWKFIKWYRRKIASAINITENALEKLNVDICVTITWVFGNFILAFELIEPYFSLSVLFFSSLFD